MGADFGVQDMPNAVSRIPESVWDLLRRGLRTIFEIVLGGSTDGSAPEASAESLTFLHFLFFTSLVEVSERTHKT